MILKIVIEIIILWLVFALYMEFLVRKKGPIGGIQFYPKQVQERVVKLGLITKEKIKKQSVVSMVLLLAIDLVLPFIMIIYVNNARTYWDMVWQYYVLFMGQELYDWFVVDVWWVAISDWWLIPGTEDLNHLWHDPKIKFLGKIKLIFAAVIIAVLAGGIYWGIMGV
ncbi:MAG: hypothetical protein J6K58_14595 [Lachnospiraceae bacterium]|nr:hypothetical protein [Lachnospiraceae bacterium]